VYGTEKAYIVPELKTKTEPEGLRLGRAILQRDIEPDQAFKLLAEGKTDLIKGFVSNRTKRPFDAHLTMDFDKGKIGFAFPERAPRPPKASK
jgi:DNA topoisomerase-3